MAAVRDNNGYPETPTVTRVQSGLTSVVTTQLTSPFISDQIQSTATDPAGNVYVVLASSTNSPPEISTTPGAYQASGGAFAVLKADAAALAGPPGATPLIGAVTNAASGVGGVIAAAEIIVIYGQNLGPTQLMSASFDSNGLLPTTLAGTTVLIGGRPAPLLYTSALQVAAVVPVSVPGADVEVSVYGAVSLPVLTTILPAIPGLFSADESGRGQGAFLNQDGSVNSLANPAAEESIISLLCSGCGLTAPPGADGAISNSLAMLANPITVLIGNQPAEVSYAGAAPSLVNGAVQINAKIPPGVKGTAVPVVVLAGGSIPPSLPVTVAVN